jgi:cytochrome c biogenesis protein ResB
MMQKHFIVVLMIFIVSLSGCPQPTTTNEMVCW